MSGAGEPDRKGRGRRLLWFVALYAASLLAFTAVVYALRALVPR
ncbi:MAG TPA: hypothetical protein VM434_03430 [Beijerinckiaceae bacterium]|nr:hypothetical protein [Beijerinckiaceae bacterium]